MSHRHSIVTRLATLAGALAAAVVFGAAGAASAQAEDLFLPGASIGVDAPYQLVGGTALLTGTADFVSIPGSKYYVMIRDMTTGLVLTTCATNACSVSVTQNVATTHTYRAYVTAFDGSYQAGSNPVKVTWGGFVLNADDTYPYSGTATTLRAKSLAAGVITIKDKQTGAIVKTCPGSPCAGSVVNYQSTHTYVATQAARQLNPPPSNDVTVHWYVIG